MTLYRNQQFDSPVQHIELVEGDGKQFIFLHALPRTEPEKLDTWVARSGLPMQELTRTHVDGHEVLVATTNQSAEATLKTLSDNGQPFEPQKDAPKANLWKLRGWASIIGQPLQLASGMLQKGTIDPATIGFASANMIANITNIIFGAEKKEDTNRLHFIKKGINRDLDEHLAPGANVLDPNEKRLDTRDNDVGGKKADSGAYAFMQRNSVKVGEIGLRYIGALSLAFPFVKVVPGHKPWSMEGLKKGSAHWEKGISALMAGEAKTAFKTLANGDKFTRNAGLAYLAGKTIAFASKIPDPYENKPHTAVDTLRERIVFPASSLIETVAAGLIAYNGLFKRKINWNKPFVPKALHFGETRDYLGGIGGMLFTAGLMIRIFAPFGKKEMDMNEVTAHITDTLVNTPPEKMPRLLADSAATVYEHTKDKGTHFGELFAGMAHDLESHHRVAFIPDKPASPEMPVLADAQQNAADEQPKFASDKLKSTLKNITPAGSFQELVANTQGTAYEPAL